MVEGLIEYTDFCLQVPVKERLFFPLVIVFRFCFDSLRLSQQKAREILQYLLDFNESISPSKMGNREPEKPGWEFEFNNIPLFFNVNHGLHKEHKSRNLGKYMVMVVNPTENFEVAAPLIHGERKISTMIRNRVLDDNGGFLADTLSISDYEKPDWKQYQHAEGDAQLPSVCPLKIK